MRSEGGARERKRASADSPVRKGHETASGAIIIAGTIQRIGGRVTPAGVRARIGRQSTATEDTTEQRDGIRNIELAIIIAIASI
jgi:hypothetical protein